jgi:lysyl endopeptidase
MVSVIAYSAATAAGGQTCSAVAQTRICNNGTLSGSFSQQACTQVCSLPWGGSINQGQSVTAYCYCPAAPNL